MQALLHQLLQGVDWGSPDASLQLMRNMIAVVPWWPLLWWTAAATAGGAWIGWKRGRLLQGIAWSFVLGFVAWPIILALPRRVRGEVQGVWSKPAVGPPRTR